MLSEDAFNADPEANVFGEPLFSVVVAEELQFCPAGHGAVSPDSAAPACLGTSSMSGDMAFVLPAAVAAGPHPVLPTVVLNVKKMGQGA